MDPEYHQCDLDQDGHVTPSDLLLWFPHFGTMIGQVNYKPECDFDGDGRIDMADYNTLYSAYLAEWQLAMRQATGQG